MRVCLKRSTEWDKQGWPVSHNLMLKEELGEGSTAEGLSMIYENMTFVLKKKITIMHLNF